MRPLIALTARGTPLGVAERGDINAQQLQLSAHIRAAKAARLARQSSRRGARHLIAWRHQAINFILPQGAFADRQHVRVGGTALVVDADPAAFTYAQSAAARQRVLRANTGGEHQHIGRQRAAVGEVQLQPLLIANNFRRRLAGVHSDAQLADFFPQHRRAAVVQLHRHQVRRKLDNVSFQPQLLQRVGRFQPEQAAADHHAPSGGCGAGGNLVEVVQRTVNKTALKIMARHRRNKRVRARRQHQLIPVGFVTEGIAHHPRFAVDAGDRFAQAQLNTVLSEKIPFHQRQRFRAASGEIFRQMHPVIGGIALLAEHHNPILLMKVTADALLKKMVADHTVSDQH